MKKENKNKLVALIAVSVIICTAIIFRFIGYDIWNNEKVYVIGMTGFIYAFFIFEVHDKLFWSFKNTVIFIITVLLSFGFAILLSFTGVHELVPIYIPVVIFSVLYGIEAGVTFNAFYVIYIFMNRYYSIDTNTPDRMLRMLLIGLIFVLAVKFTQNFTQMAFIAITVIFSTAIVNILYFNLPYDCIRYDYILENLIAVLITLIVGLVTFFARKIYIQDHKVLNNLGKICSELFPPVAEYKKKATISYYHAVDVGDLAQLAAGKVGADCALVSAGAIYHEIGKSVSNDYVKAGVEICKANNIPDEVTDIVIEHCLKIRNPRTIESAIVMLADSIINSINYVKDKNQTISTAKIIENVMRVRLESGALSECGMNIEQYNQIRQAFLAAYTNK